jgi:uncharacterized membrane protein YwaF
MPAEPVIPAPGPPLFGAEHTTVLVVTAGVAAAFVIALRRTHHHPRGPLVRQVVCWTVTLAMLTAFAIGQAEQVLSGTWSLHESLPLHLCGFGLFITAASLVLAAGNPDPVRWHTGARDLRFRPLDLRQRLLEIAYLWGIGGTSQAILTPDVIGTFPAVSCLRYFFEHCGILVGVLVLTLGLGMRPWPGTVSRVWWLTLLLAVLVMAANALLGANYMYLCGPPANPTLYDYFGPWPWSLIPLVLVGTLILWLCYSPYWIMDLLTRRRRLRQASR